MKQKIDAMIALASFGAMGGAHVAIIPALIAFEITKNSTVGFWVYVASLVPSVMICVFFFLRVAVIMSESLAEKGEWVTVQSASGEKKKRYIPPTVYNMGKRDHETEQHFVDKYG